MLLRAVISVALAAVAASLPDSGLSNTTQVAFSLESTTIYLGSPSIVRCSLGYLLASHDQFGAAANTAFVSRSADEGATWKSVGQVPSMYWASLFTRSAEPSAVYLMGTTSDSYSVTSEVSIARSMDCGGTWNRTTLTAWQHDISTGPTPVLEHGGRLWRAYERNDGGWATGYGAFVASAAADAPDLLDPGAWTMSEVLDFSSVAAQVPANWSRGPVQSAFGWLEGNAVAPPNASDPGVFIVLRVNSNPTANKAALLYVGGPAAVPDFRGWLDLPGGMSKFTIRYDDQSAHYVTLSNNVEDDRVTAPPICMDAGGGAPGAGGGPVGEAIPLPCCSMQEQLACSSGMPSCLWCHATSRNNLTLSVSPDLVHWRVVATVMADDSGLPEWARQIWTGFQYADFMFSGDDLLGVVRAGYRGSECFHNSNRVLFQTISSWRRVAGLASSPPRVVGPPAVAQPAVSAAASS